ncbi:BlaI/MecI/CopY family transcriptional regulator [Siphonobacter aquaeclarae]|jgi:BlaI family penicillinase repressor|uniref:Predicted transcriptional regulator n=1 Tax=Siphonobacter aquaeclarae TaxID=563176 RepID=A0A1G9XJW1_9BACT|nr:BlaI/MecI/CopY family transcriptional regulator [Siphonobacter aquaeclarae]SDM97047.1 Predicted transcriptional regulator [Siphonobacter aquaeclarae]
MEELTKTEERIMLAVWELDAPFFVKDLVERMPEKPPYNTVSSVVRILENKGFLGYKAYGRTYEYFASISKEEYRKNGLRRLLDGYFDSSAVSLLSFMAKEEQISPEQLDALRKLIDGN